MSSFHVDGRVSIKLEYDLAMRLGEFILSSCSEDKQFVALGHKLLNLDEDDESPNFRKREFYQQKEVIRSTGRVLKDSHNQSMNVEPWHQEHEHEIATKTPIRIRSKYSKNV